MPDRSQNEFPVSPVDPVSPIDNVLADYLQRVDEGEPVDREQFLKQHPEFADELRAFFATDGYCEELAAAFSPELAAVETDAPAACAPTISTGEVKAGPLFPGAKPGQLGDYELLEEIARGGMGVIFKARQISLNRIVAVKLILYGQLASPDELRRFQAEAEAAAGLQHPHIVAIHEVGECEGRHYFSMDYIEGANLAQITCDDLLPAREAAELLRTVAQAVDYAHQQGTLHRDLKPSNILIDSQGEPRVTDFGLAKRIEVDSQLTATGQILGTPSYMSPDQATGGDDASGPASDIYSLGAILYELLTGRPPFRAATPVETLRQVCGADPVSPRRLNDKVASDLETVCLKCLEKQPSRRYATAGELADDLGRFLEGHPILARPPTPLDRAIKWAHRNIALAVAVLAVVVAVLVIAVGLARHSQQLGALNEDLEETNSRLQTTNQSLVESIREEEKARAESNHQRRIAQASELATLESRYPLVIKSAAEALRNADPVQTIELLDRIRPTVSQPDLRGIEWHYLRSLAENENEPFKVSTAALYCIEISHDGRLLVAGGEDGGVRIWDLATMELRRTVETASLGVRGVAVSSDKTRLATVGDEGLLKLWDLSRDGTFLYETKHPGRIYRVLFTPDGKKLITSGQDSLIRLWNAETGEEVGRLEGHTDSIEGLALSGDGRFLASASDDRTVKLWSLDTKSVLQTFTGHTGRVTAVAFSTDGKTVASGSVDLTVRAWNVSDGKSREVGRHLDPIHGITFSSTGDHVIACDRGGAIRVWPTHGATEDVANSSKTRSTTLRPPSSWQAHAGRAYAVSAVPIADRIVSVGQDGYLKTWSVAAETNQRLLHTPDTEGKSGDFAAIPGTSTLVVAGQGRVHIWDYETDSLSTLIPKSEGHWGRVSVWPDGSKAAAANDAIERNGTVAIIDLHTRSVHESIDTGPNTPIGILDCSPNGSLLALDAWPEAAPGAPHPDLLWLYDTNTIQRIPNFEIVGCNCLAFSPDSRLLAMGIENNTVVWNLKEGSQQHVLRGHANSVWDIAFSPNGTTIATSSEDRHVKIWSTADGSEKIELSGIQTRNNAIVFSPDGKTLVLGTGTGNSPTDTGVGSISLWHAATGQHMFDFASTPSGVQKLRFASDHRLVCRCANNEILVYEFAPVVDPAR
jgi:WD40 repeat protein/serine/threonine protein kinase